MSESISIATLAKRFDLERCRHCGACSQACPSAKAGGVLPDAVVDSVLREEEPEGIWDCLLCHRCMAACPVDIDIVMLMTRLRHRSALAGEAPDRFRRTGGILIREGRGFPTSRRVETQRKSLGLEPLLSSEKAQKEMEIIIARTRFAHD